MHGDVFLLHLVGGGQVFDRLLDLGGSGDGRLLDGLLLRLGFFGIGFFGIGFFGIGFLGLGFFVLGLGLGFFFFLGFVGLDVFLLLLGRFLDLLRRRFGLLFDLFLDLFVGLGFFCLLRFLGLRLRFRLLHRFRRGLGFRFFSLRRGRGFRLLHGFRRGRFLLRRFFLSLLLDHLDDFGVLVRLGVLGKAGHAARDAQRRREHQRHNLVPIVFHLEKPPSDWFVSIF